MLNPAGPRIWSPRAARGDVEVLISPAELEEAETSARPELGLTIAYTALEPVEDVPAPLLRRARILVLEVDPAHQASLDRLVRTCKLHPELPILAAVRSASIPVVRTLLKAGVRDVLPLPLASRDLSAAVAQIQREMASEIPRGAAGKLISVIKSVGGVGATSLLVQLAALYARREMSRGGAACLLDLDLQFGDAGTYLGLSPTLTIADLIEAGPRLDASMLQSALVEHGSGLMVACAPQEMIPLEAIETDQVLEIADLAVRQYGTVFLDLPDNWTNWSMSLVARSQLVLLVVELSIASLRQAQRQLALLEKQDLGGIPLQVVVNRTEKKLFRPINLDDAREALGRPVSLAIANDFALMSSACDQGLLVEEVKPKSRVGRDLAQLMAGCDALLERGD